ncbi:hypothetical protein [Hymenobacter arizonensis]|uniref:hypothetical protein n=1 Tax=Hymenobacter arizonensis TaxID=1227077 RepID=UPI001160483B|nr:hypothetical protein [Hymenobacter arizonensis]
MLFFTRVELHGVLPAESQAIYDTLHDKMLQQGYRTTVDSTTLGAVGNYQWPSGMYCGTSQSLTAAQARQFADNAVAHTGVGPTKRQKVSIHARESNYPLP